MDVKKMFEQLFEIFLIFYFIRKNVSEIQKKIEKILVKLKKKDQQLLILDNFLTNFEEALKKLRKFLMNLVNSPGKTCLSKFMEPSQKSENFREI